MLRRVAITSSRVGRPKTAFAFSSQASNEQALIYASASGQLGEVKQLVDGGVSASTSDYDRRSALHLAVAEGHLDIAKYLVQKGAAVNSLDRFEGTPLDGALEGKNVELVRFLREKGATFGRSQQAIANLMISAAAQGDVARLAFFPRMWSGCEFVQPRQAHSLAHGCCHW